LISKTKLSIARKILDLLTPAERRSAVALLGLMFIGILLETLGIGLVIPAIALLTQRDFMSNYPALQPVLQALGNPSQQILVIGGMAVLLGVYLIKTMYLTFYTWRQMRFTFDVQVMLSQRLFTVYLRQPYTFHLQRNSAQLIQNVTSEVDSFSFTALLPGISLLTETLVLAGFGSLLFTVEPLGTLIVACVLGMASWSFHRFTRGRIARWGKARQHHAGLRIQHLQQGLGGVKDVKLLGRETEFLEQYRLHNTQSARVNQLHQTSQQLPRLWLELLAVSGLAMLVLTMLAQGRAPEAMLPTLGLFAAAAFRLMPSVNRMLAAVHSLRFGLPVIDTLHAELKLAAPEPTCRHSSFTPFRAALELKQVTYTYSGATEPALKNISLAIQRGESVGFVGTSGAGKSTLVDILLGLLTPDSGAVRVDGEDIQHALRNWQDQIGYVSQSIFLTDDTLARNVAFGLSNAQIDEAAVWQAIRAAQLEEFVQSLPQGLNTLVGERGVRLSGGQRQRIGISRALYHDPAVLVLDEATSSLDTATEHSVMQAVNALRGSKTVIVVAHRLSTVEHCNRLYRLERGRITGQGNYEVMTRVSQVRA
jgi:ABC-type multidrug transport system fused ATPase/permease subunit